ncbi:hypothetical protein F511_35710 [Dorcoceras hygrometricum]|uniref:Uncharacterized protein n=1 Tax=Dorcoceras hygrometricum TaxID=472368 RepID=A0A2Z7A7Y0_9LAMI|nr:hypothetical protein F511_35710 [Dorcoceras hygrometricum]
MRRRDTATPRQLLPSVALLRSPMAGAQSTGPPVGPAGSPGPSHSQSRDPQCTIEAHEGGSSHTALDAMRPHVQPWFSHDLSILSSSMDHH